MKNITIICLTVITVAEIIFANTLEGSLFLWLMYGVYKFIRFAFD